MIEKEVQLLRTFTHLFAQLVTVYHCYLDNTIILKIVTLFNFSFSFTYHLSAIT